MKPTMKFYCREAKNGSIIVQNVVDGYFAHLHYYTHKEFKNWIKDNHINKKDIIFKASKNDLLKEK